MVLKYSDNFPCFDLKVSRVSVKISCGLYEHEGAPKLAFCIIKQFLPYTYNIIVQKYYKKEEIYKILVTFLSTTREHGLESP